MKVRVIVNRSGGTLKGAEDEEARVQAASPRRASMPTCG